MYVPVDSIDLHKIMMRAGGGVPKRSDSGSRSNWARRSMYATKKQNKKKCPRPSASVEYIKPVCCIVFKVELHGSHWKCTMLMSSCAIAFKVDTG